MGKYLLAYTGGNAPTTDEERAASTEAWTSWFTSLGEAVVDAGNPFGPSSAVTSDGSVVAASAGLTGYSIISADSLNDAVEISKACPHLKDGGDIQVYETFEIM